MRRLIKIALIVLGIRWFLRWRKRRRAEAELAAAPAAAADPADELRQKLAASRLDETESDEPGPAPDVPVEDRRADVHEHGRATVEEMKSSGEA